MCSLLLRSRKPSERRPLQLGSERLQAPSSVPSLHNLAREPAAATLAVDLRHPKNLPPLALANGQLTLIQPKMAFLYPQTTTGPKPPPAPGFHGLSVGRAWMAK